MPATRNRRCRGSQVMSVRLTQVFCACAEMTPRPSRSSATSLSACARSAIGLAREARDVGAASAELLFQPLEAPVEMVDAIDDRLPLRDKAGDDKRNRSAQIGRHHRRAAQALDAADHGRVALELDVCAETGKLLHVHKTVLENGLLD